MNKQVTISITCRCGQKLSAGGLLGGPLPHCPACGRTIQMPAVENGLPTIAPGVWQAVSGPSRAPTRESDASAGRSGNGDHQERDATSASAPQRPTTVRVWHAVLVAGTAMLAAILWPVRLLRIHRFRKSASSGAPRT
jgi:hypothetical protein